MKQILKIRAANDARTPRFAQRATERRTPNTLRPPRSALAYAAALEILG